MLSKSKLVAFRQCEKKLWLEIHRPDLRSDSAATQSSYAVGNMIGELARSIYDPDGYGVFIDLRALGFNRALEATHKALAEKRTVFEAGFSCDGALSFADVMLPTSRGWRMVEVKSSTKVKDYHRDDVAIQRCIAERSGVEIAAVAIAHLNTRFVYQGGRRYDGLFHEVDVTDETAARRTEVTGWIKEANAVSRRAMEPKRDGGPHCSSPNRCGFFDYCNGKPSADYPVDWLPRPSAALKAYVAIAGVQDMRDVPDRLLNASQRRVREQTVRNEEWLDGAVAAKLPDTTEPHYFVDFETIAFAAPFWTSTRPFEKIPFQFSLHTLFADQRITVGGFLDLSGENPMRAFAEALVAQCGQSGPIFVYNIGMEGSQIDCLAENYPDLRASLCAIRKRLVDLLPLTRDYYYHPCMQGSWSIKKVLLAMAPELDYATLEDVQDGSMAQQAYLEAITPSSSTPRKAHLESCLKKYCERDTWAMVVVWKKMAGRDWPTQTPGG